MSRGRLYLGASSASIGYGSNSVSTTQDQGKLYGTWTTNSGATVTSDKNLKNSIENLNENYSILFDSLEPKRFKYNDGTSDRYHTGFIAQDVNSAIEFSGLTTQDFGAFVTFNQGQEDEYSGLRYSEFIALNTWQIQKLKQRVAELEARLSAIE